MHDPQNLQLIRWDNSLNNHPWNSTPSYSKMLTPLGYTKPSCIDASSESA